MGQTIIVFFIQKNVQEMDEKPTKGQQKSPPNEKEEVSITLKLYIFLHFMFYSVTYLQKVKEAELAKHEAKDGKRRRNKHDSNPHRRMFYV
jgi:hypothetical protein